MSQPKAGSNQDKLGHLLSVGRSVNMNDAIRATGLTDKQIRNAIDGLRYDHHWRILWVSDFEWRLTGQSNHRRGPFERPHIEKEGEL
jgi:hypothetical protein